MNVLLKKVNSLFFPFSYDNNNNNNTYESSNKLLCNAKNQIFSERIPKRWNLFSIFFIDQKDKFFKMKVIFECTSVDREDVASKWEMHFIQNC